MKSTRMNIRCCCDAGKIIGSVEIQLGWQKGTPARVPTFDNKIVELEVGYVTLPHLDENLDLKFDAEYAIKSNDRPDEFWLQLRSFEPHDNSRTTMARPRTSTTDKV